LGSEAVDVKGETMRRKTISAEGGNSIVDGLRFFSTLPRRETEKQLVPNLTTAKTSATET